MRVQISKVAPRTWKNDKGDTLYFAYPNMKEMTMKIVSDELVDMARLAGKPEK